MATVVKPDDKDDDEIHRGHQPGGRLVPIPDPTLLTTRLVSNAIDDFRREIQIRFDSMDRYKSTSRELIDTKIQVIHTELIGQIGRLETKTDERFVGINSLFAERELKFKSIQIQFQERDTRLAQMTSDNKIAIDAALTAARDSVDKQNNANATATAKSEAAFTKQIDQLGFLTQQTTKTTDDKIDDLKESVRRQTDDLKARIQIIEGRGQGLNQGWGYIVGAAGIVIGIVAIINFAMHISH